MSTSTDGILAYGYDLGENFGVGYDQPENPSWLHDESEESYHDQACRALFAAAGKPVEPDVYVDADDLKELCGIEVVYHCSDGCTMYILAAKHITARRGYPQEVDLTLPDDGHERLAWAVKVLELDLGDKKPGWLLASYWG